MGALKGNGDFGKSPHQPHRYELIDKDGRTCGWFYSAGIAAQEAGRLWPDQEQDEERSGKGWDIQVVGCDR